jgi:hypothetical protein
VVLHHPPCLRPFILACLPRCEAQWSKFSLKMLGHSS